MTAFLCKQQGRTQRPHWLAGDEIVIEPVSAFNSLPTGKFTGNFVVETVYIPRIHIFVGDYRCLTPNPYTQEQGIISTEQGISDGK